MVGNHLIQLIILLSLPEFSAVLGWSCTLNPASFSAAPLAQVLCQYAQGARGLLSKHYRSVRLAAEEQKGLDGVAGQPGSSRLQQSFLYVSHTMPHLKGKT